MLLKSKDSLWLASNAVASKGTDCVTAEDAVRVRFSSEPGSVILKWVKFPDFADDEVVCNTTSAFVAVVNVPTFGIVGNRKAIVTVLLSHPKFSTVVKLLSDNSLRFDIGPASVALKKSK